MGALLVTKTFREPPAIHAATTNRWEYKVLIYQCYADKITGSTLVERAYEDGNQINIGAGGMSGKMAELGAQGWELVTVTTSSEEVDGSGFFTAPGADNTRRYYLKRQK